MYRIGLFALLSALPLGLAAPQATSSPSPSPTYSFTNLCNVKCTVNLGDQSHNTTYLCQPSVKTSVQQCVAQLCDCSIRPAANAEYDNLCGTTSPNTCGSSSSIRPASSSSAPPKPTSTPTKSMTTSVNACTPPSSSSKSSSSSTRCPTATKPPSTTVPRPRCGGPNNVACPAASHVCVKDPYAPALPAGAPTSCQMGYCVPPDPVCGGFAGFRCPAGQVCVDDPRDGCDPVKGGRDCLGLCV